MAALVHSAVCDDLARRLCYPVTDNDLGWFRCRICRGSMHNASSGEMYCTTCWADTVAPAGIQASQASSSHSHAHSPTRYCAICDALGHTLETGVRIRSATELRDTAAPPVSNNRDTWRSLTLLPDERSWSRSQDVQRTPQFETVDLDTDDTDNTEELFEEHDATQVIALATKGYQPLGGGSALGLFLPPSYEMKPPQHSRIEEPLMEVHMRPKRSCPEDGFDSGLVYKRSRVAQL